jgi:hypothetical protein
MISISYVSPYAGLDFLGHEAAWEKLVARTSFLT